MSIDKLLLYRNVQISVIISFLVARSSQECVDANPQSCKNNGCKGSRSWIIANCAKTCDACDKLETKQNLKHSDLAKYEHEAREKTTALIRSITKCDRDCGEGTCVSDNECDYCKPNQCWEGDCLSHSFNNQRHQGRNFTCKCNKGYRGRLCKDFIDDPCAENPGVCKNGGTCVVVQEPGKNRWLCLCTEHKRGMSRDCSDWLTNDEVDSSLIRKIAIVAVLFPSLGFAIGWILLCACECWEIGELPDFDPSERSKSKRCLSSLCCFSRFNDEERYRYLKGIIEEASKLTALKKTHLHLVFIGIPENKSENCIKIINKLIRRCGVFDSVLQACRVGERLHDASNSRAIVVIFKTYKQYEAVKKNKRLLPRGVLLNKFKKIKSSRAAHAYYILTENSQETLYRTKLLCSRAQYL